MKQRVFDYSFLAIGLLVQVITFWIANRYLTTTNHQTWLSLFRMSGLAGKYPHVRIRLCASRYVYDSGHRESSLGPGRS